MEEKTLPLNKWAIDLQNISKHYNGVWALKNLSFKWKDGILGLVGPNGAGKSTLIKILCTLLRPNNGSGYIYGRNLVKESLQVRQKIGVLHENPIFHPTFQVFPSLSWVGQIRGLTQNRAEKKAIELLKYFDLDYTQDFKFRELSAGMRQKYGLIQATIGNPPFIILDEPTSNMDPGARRKYEDYIQELRNEHMCSFLISSHVLGELDRLCDSFAFIFNGELVKRGTREELKLNVKEKRFRLIHTNPQKILPYFINEHWVIESITNSEIIIKGPNQEEIQRISERMDDENISEKLSIIPLESDTESIYRQLSEQYKHG